MNITRAEMQHANLWVLRQLNALDQVYQAKLEHIAGTSNTGADALVDSICMTESQRH